MQDGNESEEIDEQIKRKIYNNNGSHVIALRDKHIDCD